MKLFILSKKVLKMPDNKIYYNDLRNICLEITDGGFSAYLTIKKKLEIIDEDEIKKLIETAGIITGFDKAKEYNLKKEVEKEFNKPFLIALGEKPEQQIEIDLKLEKNSLIDPENLKDITDLNKIPFIKQSTIIADLKINGSTQKGIDIFGNEYSPENSKQNTVDDFLGKNVIYSKELEQIIAKKSGYFFVGNNGKLNVISDIIYKKDIKNSKMTIFSNLIVKADITDSEIFVDGNIAFGSAEKSRIFCKKKITIGKSARFCFLVSDREIIGNNESFIKGGKTQSGWKIEIGTIGSPFSIATEIEITVAPYLKHQISSSLHHSEEMETEFEKKLNEFLIIKKSDHNIKVLRKVFRGTFVRIYNSSITVEEDLNAVVFENIKNQIESHSI